MNEKKIMSNIEVLDFISNALRSETVENPRVYIKAMCVTLIQLGYDMEWVYDVFMPGAQYFYNE